MGTLTFGAFYNVTIKVVLRKEILKTFHMTRIQSNWIYSYPIMLNIVFGLPIGMFIDYIGIRNGIVITSLLQVLSNLLLYYGAENHNKIMFIVGVFLCTLSLDSIATA
jgi:fucose permease